MIRAIGWLIAAVLAALIAWLSIPRMSVPVAVIVVALVFALLSPVAAWQEFAEWRRMRAMRRARPIATSLIPSFPEQPKRPLR